MTLLRFNDLKARNIIRSRMTLKRAMEQHGFPQPIRLSTRSVAWDEMAVAAWLQQRSSAPRN